MGWGGVYRRRLKVFSVALLIFLDYKVLRQRERWTKESKRAALKEKAHERNAKRVVSMMIDLEGLWVKLGQFLSTHAEMFPKAYVSHLKTLQDSLPPRPVKKVRRTIEKELGKSINDMFAKFVEKPLATASIGQVHRATLINGKEVVVKVQHERIESTMLEDLKNAKSIVDWIVWMEPRLDLNPIIDEWWNEALKELDFNLEAENTRTVSRNLGLKQPREENKSSIQVDVLIPEVIQSTRSVLILEYMDGIRLNDAASLEAYGVDKQKIIEEIIRAYAHQIYVDGFFNGDPHPGNFLVTKEAPHRPILLDFGLTKKLSSTMTKALGKWFLASVAGDDVAILSAYSEMGLKVPHDHIPEMAIDIIPVFFKNLISANEALQTAKSSAKQSDRKREEKMQSNEKEDENFKSADAFPSEIVTYLRVLALLAGLESTMNVGVAYASLMIPFAECIILRNINRVPAENAQWICKTPTNSDVEAKLRRLLVEMGSNDKILGIQVCAYKDGKVIIDTAAGVLGKLNPRPVQPDALFPVFSATKGITAGMIHWLVDNGKLKLDENVGKIWPEFKGNGKDHIKVHHVLNHTSGLHNALPPENLGEDNPFLYSEWDECLKLIAASVPETEPGKQQLYHYLSFGWLCGGIIEHASGKKFQEILEEAFIKPLKLNGELYVGIPPGVESRLASLTVDTDDLNKISANSNEQPEMPSTIQFDPFAQLVTFMPALFNMLKIRRAIIPAANGHCSARALARYYAALVDGGAVPPPHSSGSNPPLGSHPHIPSLPSKKTNNRKQNGKKQTSVEDHHSVPKNEATKDLKDSNSIPNGKEKSKIFSSPSIHEAFLGVGEYETLSLRDGIFGLGFRRLKSKDGHFTGFGHVGMGGSTGFCDMENRFSIAVTLNKMSFGSVTTKIVQLVCSELNIPLPDEYSS